MNPFAHFEDQFGHLQLSDNDAALHVFLAGWNSAMMEMMQRVNKMPFGDDTRASFAVYFQSQMVNVDAIEKPAQQEPVAWMEMVVANLVREGVNKHKARELAQHFYTSPPAQRKPLTEKELMKCITQAKCFGTVKMTYESGPYEIDRLTLKAFEFARAIEAARSVKGDA